VLIRPMSELLKFYASLIPDTSSSGPRENPSFNLIPSPDTSALDEKLAGKILEHAILLGYIIPTTL